MSLLFRSPFSAFSAIDAALEDDWFVPSFAPSLSRHPSCGMAACAAPLLPAMAPAAAFRLHRQPSFAPPTEPEVHISRTAEGVLAACPLGRGFSARDIR